MNKNIPIQKCAKTVVKFVLIFFTAFVFARLSLSCTDEPPKPPHTSDPSFRIEYIAMTGGYIAGVPVQTVKYGKNGKPVSAVAYEGYRFAGWSDNFDNPGRMEEKVRKDMKLVAYFDRFCKLNYSAGIGGKIVGETNQLVTAGERGESVTAVPDEGYVFVRWSDGVLTPMRTDFAEAETCVTAEFAPEEKDD